MITPSSILGALFLPAGLFPAGILAAVLQDSPAAAPTSAPGPAPTSIVVMPGDSWDRDGSSLPAGSVVRLAPGIHRPAVWRAVQGTPEAPIVLRFEASGADGAGGQAGIIVGGEVGLELIDCRHVRVESLVVIGPTVAGIRLRGGESLSLRSVLLARLGPDVRADGIDAEGVSDLRVQGVRIDGWSDAAIDLRDVRDADVRQLELLAMSGRRNGVGIRLAGRLEGVRVEDGVIRGVPVGVELDGVEAVEDAPSSPSPTPSPSGVVIRDMLLDRPAIGLEIRSPNGVLVERSTMVDPEIAVRLPDGASPRMVRLVRNLVVWQPSRLRAFGEVAASARPEGITWGESLWWSAELPTALAILGSIPGTLEVPPRHAPDPKIDGRGIPSEPLAAEFGRPTR